MDGEGQVAHRSGTAVGSAGPVGASFAVVNANWKCVKCKAENLSKRSRCGRCRAKKPAGGGGQVWHEGAVAAAAGEDHGWREAIDPNTKQLYYFNMQTKETRWDRPKEMGEALAATGWYGRGKAGSTAQAELDEKNAEYLKRPAVKQVDEVRAKDVSYLQGTENFNIYYGKYNGDHWSRKRNLDPAKTRCKVSLHAGYTQADKRTSGTGGYFCMLWAKGGCFKGKKCNYFHRVPVYADVGRLEKDMMHDVFGRERHATHREDMMGAGSFNDPCRTVYVGKLQRTPYADKPKELELVLWKHFGEFGEVENINVIWDKSIAFVRFRFRSHAELAKEAMANQTLDHDEILDIKWAFEDPNPVAREAIRRANADAVAAAIQAAGYSTGKDTAFALPAGYAANSKEQKQTGKAVKRKALTNGDEGAGDADLYYPNTDAQYASAGDSAQPGAAKRVKT